MIIGFSAPLSGYETPVLWIKHDGLPNPHGWVSLVNVFILNTESILRVYGIDFNEDFLCLETNCLNPS